MIRHVIDQATGYLTGSPQRSALTISSEIDEEIAFHLAQRKHDLMGSGMNENDAELAANERFGDAQRIAAECFSVSMTGTTWFHRMHLVVTIGLICVVSILAWIVSQPSIEPDLPPGIAAVLREDWSGGVTGLVLDESQQPIAGANVLVAVKTWPGGSYFQRPYACQTKTDGTFSIGNVRPVNQLYEVQVAVVAKGLAMRSQYQSFHAGESKPFQFELPAADTFRLKLASSTGISLSGIDVIPVERTDTSGSRELVYFDTARPITRQADATGTIELSCFQPGDQAVLMVRCEDEDWQRVRVEIPADRQTFEVQVDL